MPVKLCRCDKKFIDSLNLQAKLTHDFFHAIVRFINKKKKFFKIYKIYKSAILNSKIIYPEIQIKIFFQEDENVKYKRIFSNVTLNQLFCELFFITHKNDEKIIEVLFEKKKIF